MQIRRVDFKVRVVLAGLVLAALLAGCARPHSELLTFTRTGGIAGVDERLTLYENGRAVLVRNGTQSDFVVDPATLDALVEQLRAANFAELQEAYLPQDTCCDLFEYTLTHSGHTVRTMDTAVPEALQPVLDTLTGMFARMS